MLVLRPAAAMLEPPVRPVISARLDEMKELHVAKRALVKDWTAARNRDRTRKAALPKHQAAQRMAQIERQIAAIDTALRTLLATDPALKTRFDILFSIPGVSETTALILLLEMPDLGALEHRCAASLADLAPFARDSGQQRGKRFIRGGRQHLRHAIYMLALVAARFNPNLKAKYDRLRAAGKASKAALSTIMRKLFILANALLRDSRGWPGQYA